MEYPGIEPGVVKTGGFTIHCITVDASTPKLLLNSGKVFNEVITCQPRRYDCSLTCRTRLQLSYVLKLVPVLRLIRTDRVSADLPLPRTGVGQGVFFFEGIEFASNSASFIRYHFTCADKPGQVRGT